MRRYQRLAAPAFAVAAAMLLGGCVRQGSYIRADPVQRDSLSASAVMLELDAVPKDSAHDCGLAAVSAVAQFHRQPVSGDTEARLRERSAANGSLTALEMRDALLEAGLVAFVLKGTLGTGVDGIPWHLRHGRPCIVLVRRDPGEGEGDAGHFLVVNGFDPEGRLVVFADAEHGPVSMPEQEFLRLWHNAESVMLVAAPGAATKGGTASNGRE
jgi:ABC-type bacteriocin/lantibiotic exporter with double-glycine peptidase domain